MKLRLLLLAIGLVAVALAFGHVLSPAPARADDVFVSQQVRDELASTGRARVIVEVRLPGPFVPEGELGTGAAAATQRAILALVQSQVLARLQGRGHTFLHRYETVPHLLLEVDADGLAALEASPFFVRRVVEDALFEPMLPQSVPLVEGPQAWASGFDGTGTVVAILDTGVDKTHPFLAGKVIEEACYSTNSSGQSASLCPNGQAEQTGPGTGVNCPLNLPLCWHGTHVAGIAAGNGAGAAVAFSGVAKGASIMAVQVFSRSLNPVVCGSLNPCLRVFTSDIMKGFERVFAVRGQHNFAAVNLSVGGGLNQSNCDGDPLKFTIDNLRSVGIATVIASGNNGWTAFMSAPACVSTAVSVGNTDKNDVVEQNSNVASFLSLFAPGTGIFSSYPGGQWFGSTGTSMSAPHVTGAFAVLKQAVPGASVTTLLNALTQTGVPVTDTREGATVTKPRIRINHALQFLSPPPPGPPRTLTVASANPDSGVLITVVPSDNGGQGNGTTPFSRVFATNAVVNLTAPLNAQSKTFQKWQRAGVDFSTSLGVPVTMDADHALTAVYVASTFADVLPSHPFWSWIEALYREGVTGGCGTDPLIFCPDQTVNRAQMAVFLLRGIHGPLYAPPAPTGVFADVPADAPFAAWIDQLFAEGIVGGCATGPLRYCPNNGVTRDQMAILLLRAKHGASYQPPPATGIFADVPANSPFAPWIERLYAEGITTGCGTSPLRYCPGQGVTRGEMAVFLDRTFGFPL